MSVAAFHAASPASMPRATNRSGLTSVCLLGADVAAVLIVAVMMVLLIDLWFDLWKEFLLAQVSMMVIFAGLELYPGCGLSPARELREIFTGSTISHGLAATAFFVWRPLAATRLSAGILFSWAATVVLVVLCSDPQYVTSAGTSPGGECRPSSSAPPERRALRSPTHSLLSFYRYAGRRSLRGLLARLARTEQRRRLRDTPRACDTLRAKPRGHTCHRSSG